MPSPRTRPRPAYDPRLAAAAAAEGAARLRRRSKAGCTPIGHDGRGFAFDNEGPRHEVLLRDVRLRGGS